MESLGWSVFVGYRVLILPMAVIQFLGSYQCLTGAELSEVIFDLTIILLFWRLLWLIVTLSAVRESLVQDVFLSLFLFVTQI